MKYPRSAVAAVVEALLTADAHTATKFLGPNVIVRATRPLTKRGRLPQGNPRVHLVLTLGRPNYRERQFVKACQAAGEKFPVKKVQLRFPPKRRK